VNTVMKNLESLGYYQLLKGCVMWILYKYICVCACACAHVCMYVCVYNSNNVFPLKYETTAFFMFIFRNTSYTKHLINISS